MEYGNDDPLVRIVCFHPQKSDFIGESFLVKMAVDPAAEAVRALILPEQKMPELAAHGIQSWRSGRRKQSPGWDYR